MTYTSEELDAILDKMSQQFMQPQITRKLSWFEHGWEFAWELEGENPRDVFGEPDPAVNGPFYDPENEFYTCVCFGPMPEDCPVCGRDPEFCQCRLSAKREVLASLGMIEAPTAEYRRVVQAELAAEAMPEPVRAENS